MTYTGSQSLCTAVFSLCLQRDVEEKHPPEAVTLLLVKYACVNLTKEVVA